MAYDKEYYKEYYERTKEKKRLSSREYYQKNRDAERKKAAERYWKNRDAKLKRAKELSEIRKDAAYEHYGGYVCACCGETEKHFLTIDHIHGNGRQHRKLFPGGGGYIYAWLKRENYPDGFQVLCYNCNCGRARNNDICPHVSKKQ